LEKALRCLAEATDKTEFRRNSTLWLRLAQVQLAAGRIDGYQATRNTLFETYKTAKIPEDLNAVAWTAALAKDTKEGSKRAVSFAERAHAVIPKNPGYLNTLGAVLYRVGEKAKAIENLEQAVKERKPQRQASPERWAYGNALDKLFMAMAQYIPEHPEQARQTLAEALKSIEDYKKRLQSSSQSGSVEQVLSRVWNDLEFDFLQHEATRLINP
jgi:tetratricopeptide (TPR) repeat protein